MDTVLDLQDVKGVPLAFASKKSKAPQDIWKKFNAERPPLVPSDVLPRGFAMQFFGQFLNEEEKANVRAYVAWQTISSTREAKAPNPALLLKLPIPKSVCSNFKKAFNGAGLDHLTRWLVRSVISDEDAYEILSDAVQEGLIAAFNFLADSSGASTITERERPLLTNAIKAQLPLRTDKARQEFAEQLLGVLEQRLNDGTALRIDGGVVQLKARAFIVGTGDGFGSKPQFAERRRPEKSAHA